ncbi:hypothetical protein TH606_02205 [Thermodesulfatator autotrophicus]|uniref:Uncharacterized protein n=1 Tax=Thermodesulfatator autotrophicus TaxID=1795632 RepID=A0A177E8Q5_9BACT|nr:hypothetical protein TH606_02205 [Thermodesulfatator autotrophicus]
MLDDEDFEHHDGVIGFTADFREMEGKEDLFEGCQLMSSLMRDMSSGRFWYMRCLPIVSWPLFFLNIKQPLKF